jgi:hypothetical protein
LLGRGLLRYRLLGHGPLGHGLLRHGLLRHGLLRYGRLRYGRLRYGRLRYGLLGHGLLWGRGLGRMGLGRMSLGRMGLGRGLGGPFLGRLGWLWLEDIRIVVPGDRGFASLQGGRSEPLAGEAVVGFGTGHHVRDGIGHGDLPGGLGQAAIIRRAQEPSRRGRHAGPGVIYVEIPGGGTGLRRG